MIWKDVLLERLDNGLEARWVRWWRYEERAVQLGARARIDHRLGPYRCEVLGNEVRDLATKPLHGGLVEVEW